MERVGISPRENYKSIVEGLGLTFHEFFTDKENETKGIKHKYWSDEHYYLVDPSVSHKIEIATQELYSMCIAAVKYVIENESVFLNQFQLSPELYPCICKSWLQYQSNPKLHTLYSRFDFSFPNFDNPNCFPKMLEINADTPTILLECSLVQRQWMEQVFFENFQQKQIRSSFSHLYDSISQYNTIEDGLKSHWEYILENLSEKEQQPDTFHFCSIAPSEEDFQTVAFIMKCFNIVSHSKGYNTKSNFLYIQDVGFSEESYEFVDLQNKPISHLFKLYAWEWLIEEFFGPQMLQLVSEEQIHVYEPLWKMILTHKGLMAILWKLFPGNKYLLPSYFSKEDLVAHTQDSSSFVKKPFYGREGNNVSITQNHQIVCSHLQTKQVVMPFLSKPNTEFSNSEGYLYQQLCLLPRFDDRFYTAIGSWVIGEQACGMGMREDSNMITRNLHNSFVPHIVATVPNKL